MSYVGNIEQASLENTNFRRVIYTAPHCQLVVMHLQPSEDIGEEIHQVDQFIRVEAGNGVTVLDGKESAITDGSAIVIPAGTKHNIINRSVDAPMKLYTLYAPPQHRDGTVHATKAAAEADEADEFHGV